MEEKTETKAVANKEHYKNIFYHTTSLASLVPDNLGVRVRRKHTSYILDCSLLFLFLQKTKPA
jgi:hypothetical protein